MAETIKLFSLNDIELYKDDKDKDFAYAKLYMLSEGNNSHKNPIDIKVLKKYAKTALGKFIIAKFDAWTGDVTTHLPSETIMGYVDPASTITFEEKDGKTFAVVQGIISKLYATEVVEMFKEKNQRFVSCEFSAVEAEEDENGDRAILSFNIHGITILGLKYKPSCEGAEMKIIKFAEQESGGTLNKLKDFTERRKMFMAENKVTESEVIRESDISEENKMTKEIEFAAVDISDMWGKVHTCLQSKYPEDEYCSIYRIDGIYEENCQKFAIIHKRDEDIKYRLDFSLTENGIECADEITEVKLEIVETDTVLKFAEPEDSVMYKEFAVTEIEEQLQEQFEEDVDKETDNKTEEMSDNSDTEDEEDEKEDSDSDDETEKELATEQEETKEFSYNATVDMAAINVMLEQETDKYKTLINSAIDSKDMNIIMSDYLAMAKERDELKAFQEQKIAEEIQGAVDSCLAEAKNDLTEEQFIEFTEKGKECTMETLGEFSNTVKAFAYENSKNKNNKKDKKDEHITMRTFADFLDKPSQQEISVKDLYAKYTK